MLGVQLLALRAEFHTLQLRHLEGQLLDAGVAPAGASTMGRHLAKLGELAHSCSYRLPWSAKLDQADDALVSHALPGQAHHQRIELLLRE